MKRGAGKAKGSSFERKIAKALSLWLTRGVDATQLIRSVLSGGWTRGQLAGVEGWRHVGDLAPNGPTGEAFRKRWAVECKHRRDIDLYSLWTRTNAKESLVGWWRKLNEDAAAAGLDGRMLVFCSNCRPIMVAIPTSCAPDLLTQSALSPIIFPLEKVAIFPFQELLKSDPNWVLT